MQKSTRWVHVLLEVVGGLSIVAGLAWLALYALSYPFRYFSGGNCDEAEQKELKSPDGKHTIKSFHRTCGAGAERPHSYCLVYLSTGNPNPGYEYTQVVEIRDVAIGQTSVTWDGPMNSRFRIQAPQRWAKLTQRLLGCISCCTRPCRRVVQKRIEQGNLTLLVPAF